MHRWMMTLESGLLNVFSFHARFCAAGEEREARGQNHCAPATSLAFWKGISSFSSASSIPSHSSPLQLAYERTQVMLELILVNDLTDQSLCMVTGHIL